MDRLQEFGRYSKRVFNRLIKREEVKEDADWNFNTYITDETRIIVWNIDNINKSALKFGEYYESPSFSTGFSSEVKWTLRVYPAGRKESDKFGVFIYKISENSRAHFKYEFNVILVPELWEDGIFSKEISSKSFRMSDKNVDLREWGTDELFPNTCLLLKKSLCVHCRLTVIHGDGDDENCDAGPSKKITLHNDFKEMYNSGKFSDVTLKVGEKMFPAHKAILAARSQVFAVMIDELDETNIITIEDVDPLLMASVLQYIYTGCIEDFTAEKAVDIFPATVKYSLRDLQKYCVAIMLSNLSVENVCQIAILFDLHSRPQLKTATYTFFQKYQHEIFTVRKEWKELCQNYPKLASDVLQALSKAQL